MAATGNFKDLADFAKFKTTVQLPPFQKLLEVKLIDEEKLDQLWSSYAKIALLHSFSFAEYSASYIVNLVDGATLELPFTIANGKIHVHIGESLKGGPNVGKWNGDGGHDYNQFVRRIKADGYAFLSVKEDPATGVREVEVQIPGRSKPDIKTEYPVWLNANEIDELGEQALAIAKENGILTSGTTRFKATVTMPNSTTIEIVGYYEEILVKNNIGNLLLDGAGNPIKAYKINTHYPNYLNASRTNWVTLPNP